MRRHFTTDSEYQWVRPWTFTHHTTISRKALENLIRNDEIDYITMPGKVWVPILRSDCPTCGVARQHQVNWSRQDTT